MQVTVVFCFFLIFTTYLSLISHEVTVLISWVMLSKTDEKGLPCHAHEFVANASNCSPLYIMDGFCLDIYYPGKEVSTISILSRNSLKSGILNVEFYQMSFQHIENNLIFSLFWSTNDDIL